MVSFKTLVKNKGHWITLSAVLFLLPCCKNDNEEPYPRLRAEFFDVIVNEDTAVTSIILDNGKTFPLNEGHTIKAQVPDTTFRCYGSIELALDSSYAKIYEVYMAHCYSPSSPKIFKPNIFYKNPVGVLTVYKARHYINAIIKAKISGIKDHAYDLVKDSITTDPDTKKKTMHITFFHYKPEEEYEAYTQKLYISVPMDQSHYDKDELFDSLEFHVHTYDGEKRYKYGKDE